MPTRRAGEIGLTRALTSVSTGRELGAEVIALAQNQGFGAQQVEAGAKEPGVPLRASS